MTAERRHNPDSMVLLGLLAVVALALTISGHVPGTVARSVPLWIGLVWSAAFAASCGIAFVGLLWRDPLTGWSLEIAGRVGISATALAYAIMMVSEATFWGTAIVLSTVAALGLASVWRIFQLARRLREIRSAVEAVRGELT